MAADPEYYLERLARLTGREREVLVLNCEGLKAGPISKLLDIGERTVYDHLDRIYAKLEIADLREHLRQRQLAFF
ncbi:MAG TPA: helix-turn-helix transcriptional regulator [Thermomicrobiales bacterium]|nr:helix-turn-helix transcriptional regulator [Thermomicrobiales bacterium]